MTIGTAALATTNLDAMDNEQLVAEIKKSKEELFNLRFQAATDQLDNHGRLKAVRRDIARVYTVLRERELGVRTAPSAVSGADSNTKDKAKDNAKNSDSKANKKVSKTNDKSVEKKDGDK